jgi:hypothetical protein
LRLVLFGNGKSLALGREAVEHVTALAASEAIGMVSHVGGDLALVALVLQLLDLARSLNVVVVEESLGSLLVLVLYLLGLGVDLLLSLSLTTIESDEGVNRALGLEACLLKSKLLDEGSSVENESIDGVFNLFLNLGSKQK